MSNSRNTRYESLGLEWVQIDAQREALFEFILELVPGKEPVVKTIVPTIPNISGQGNPGQAVYPMRPAKGAIKPEGIQQPAPGVPFERKPGLTIVNPEEDGAPAVPTNIPSRRDKRDTQ